jgi:hypothetical protein
MQGPSAATTLVAPSPRIAATVSPTTPASSPRQPAWAAPMTPSGLDRAIGAQSAVKIANAVPGTSLTAPSAGSPAAAPGWSTTTTRAPWTCCKHVQGRSTTARRRAETASSVPEGSAMSPSDRSLKRTSVDPANPAAGTGASVARRRADDGTARASAPWRRSADTTVTSGTMGRRSRRRRPAPSPLRPRSPARSRPSRGRPARAGGPWTRPNDRTRPR